MSGERGRFADLTLRSVTGIVLAALTLLVVFLDPLLTDLYFAAAAALMAWEFHRLFCGKRGFFDRGLDLLVVCTAGAVVVTGFIGLFWGLAVLIAGAVGLYLLRLERRGWLIAGLIYIGFAVSGIAYLRLLPEQGSDVLIWLIFTVMAADIAAYLVGSAIGGPKVWPSVSPGKTWSGLAGGWLAAIAVGVLVSWLTGLYATVAAVGLALALAVASQIGDFLESAIKRRNSVKDSSGLLPGHGGVLDRLDSMMGASILLTVLYLAGVL